MINIFNIYKAALYSSNRLNIFFISDCNRPTVYSLRYITTELLFYLTHGNVHLAFLRSLCKKRMACTGVLIYYTLDSSTRPAELNVRSLDALVAGNGIQSCLALSWRVTWRQRFGDIKQVTLLRRPSYCNLIKEPNKIWNRYSQIFNIGYRELHATYMDFFICF